MPFFILFIIVFITLGCTKDKLILNSNMPNQPVDTSKIDSTKKIRYLALGDSYTIGQSVAEGERFPAQTAALLATDNIFISTLQYIATTGWTTQNLINAINNVNPPSNNDIVTLLIGVNDQYQGVDTGTYRTHFIQLLNTSIALAANSRSRVFVLSIPDYSVTPFVSSSDKARVSREIDWFNAINKQVTLQNNVTYVDITLSTRQAASDTSLIAFDGLHPSGKEYKKWAAILAPLIAKALK